jgi:hypothetical protein
MFIPKLCPLPPLPSCEKVPALTPTPSELVLLSPTQHEAGSLKLQ